jgi:hypothetical protein
MRYQPHMKVYVFVRFLIFIRSNGGLIDMAKLVSCTFLCMTVVQNIYIMYIK